MFEKKRGKSCGWLKLVPMKLKCWSKFSQEYILMEPVNCYVYKFNFTLHFIGGIIRSI